MRRLLIHVLPSGSTAPVTTACSAQSSVAGPMVISNALQVIGWPTVVVMATSGVAIAAT
jgi:hypothetical protein